MSENLTRGTRVKMTTANAGRALTEFFPGWGAPGYMDHLVDIQPGWTGTITDIESHGANPWTRYGIRFDNGTRAFGVGPARFTVIGA